MPAMHTRLGASHQAMTDILHPRTDLRHGPTLAGALALLAERRTMDLSDLPPAEQARLIGARAVALLPSTDRLAELLATAGRRLVVKFGIDPTAADVHVGHAVPMILASRFQRMGHRVVFIVGDVTASIGDPSGRAAGRPALTRDDITRNMATYRQQVAPFFDFDRADFRFNSEWLAPFRLPEFLDVLARLPLSAALQRDDFRGRLAAGAGLTLAELVYSVVMALDSVQVEADVEIGGLDQLLNLQMCRRVMEHAGQVPEVVIATALIEGTDGTGAKMSKSTGNVVGLGFTPRDVFGKLMSAADRLLPGYLRALTELLDPEIELLRGLHPMGVKTLLAADVTATIHGLDAAVAAQADFAAQFSRRRYSDATGVPRFDMDHNGQDHNGQFTVGTFLVRITEQVPSLNRVRRVARDGGLRLVVETPDARNTVRLTEADVDRPVASVLSTVDAQPGARLFLACGRALVELTRT